MAWGYSGKPALFLRRMFMSLLKMARTLTFVMALAAMAVGCRGATPTAVSPKSAKLQEVFDMYQHFIKSHEKPPHQLSDLTGSRYEGIAPTAVAELKKGNLIVVWDLQGKDASKVLAYEKQALTQGGSVLMADGSMREMSADELRAAVPNNPANKK
jgi:hypothetical protein